MITIKEIIKDCGGVVSVAYRLNISHSTVVAWKVKGIPSNYWEKIIKFSKGKYDINDLFFASKSAKNKATQLLGAKIA